MKQTNIINAREVASMLGVCYSQALILARKGELPHFHAGKMVKFRRSDIERYVDEQIAASTKHKEHVPA